MMGGYIVFALLVLLVNGVFMDKKEVKEGKSVPLNTNVTKGDRDIVWWYFNDTLIALINGHPETSCKYDGEDGRFRGRLEVDYKTGSLTINNITTEHTGRYEAELFITEISGKEQIMDTKRCDSTKIIKKNNALGKTIKTFSVIVTGTDQPKKEFRKETGDQKPDMGSGLSTGAVAGIAVAVLMLVCVAAVVGGIYYRRRSFRKATGRGKGEYL